MGVSREDIVTDTLKESGISGRKLRRDSEGNLKKPFNISVQHLSSIWEGKLTNIQRKLGGMSIGEHSVNGPLIFSGISREDTIINGKKLR